MASLKQIAGNPEKEKEGIWTNYRDTDFALKIARVSNPDFDQHRRALIKPHRHRSSRGMLTEKEAGKIIAPAVAKHLVKDWRNLEDDGKAIPYSEQKCLEMLCDDKFYDLYEFILQVANDGEAYRFELEQESAGNSPSSSNGTSPGLKTSAT